MSEEQTTEQQTEEQERSPWIPNPREPISLDELIEDWANFRKRVIQIPLSAIESNIPERSDENPPTLSWGDREYKMGDSALESVFQVLKMPHKYLMSRDIREEMDYMLKSRLNFHKEGESITLILGKDNWITQATSSSILSARPEEIAQSVADTMPEESQVFLSWIGVESFGLDVYVPEGSLQYSGGVRGEDETFGGVRIRMDKYNKVPEIQPLLYRAKTQSVVEISEPSIVLDARDIDQRESPSMYINTLVQDCLKSVVTYIEHMYKLQENKVDDLIPLQRTAETVGLTKNVARRIADTVHFWKSDEHTEFLLMDVMANAGNNFGATKRARTLQQAAGQLVMTQMHRCTTCHQPVIL